MLYVKNLSLFYISHTLESFGFFQKLINDIVCFYIKLTCSLASKEIKYMITLCSKMEKKTWYTDLFSISCCTD